MIFNISIDSSSLKTFSSIFLHLLHIIKRTNAFSKMYDILCFSNFLCLAQIGQRNFFILTFLVIEIISALFYHSFHICFEKLTESNTNVSTPQPTPSIPGMFAECSLSVAMFGTSRKHLGNILKRKIF